MPKASKVRRPHSLAVLAAAGAWLAPVLSHADETEVNVQSLASIRAAAEEEVRSQLHGPGFELQVHGGALDPRLHFPRCLRPLTSSLRSGTQFGGRVTVRVSCEAPQTPWAVFVPLTIESEVRVLVLRQGAARGSRIAADDVVTEVRRVGGLPGDYLTDATALSRRTLVRTVPAGTVLTAELLQSDYLVRQGQPVTLVASAPGIEVRAPARALEDAHEGGRVHVQNLASQKVVQGIVDGSGLVYVTP
jgi:flagellar basal body P-ring formation protein FlgA